MIINTAPGGGGSKTDLNLFCQPDQPKTFDGLWIQTPTKQSVKKIVNKPSFVIGGNWAANGTVPAIPDLNSAQIYDSLYYNGKIYYLCRQNFNTTTSYMYIIEYDIATKTYSPTHQLGYVSGNASIHSTFCGLFMALYGNTIKVYVYAFENNGAIGRCIVYHTDTHVVDTAVSITPPMGTVSDALSSLGQDADNLYFTFVPFSSTFAIYKLNLATNTTTVLYTNTEPQGSSYLWYACGIISNNKIYFVEGCSYPGAYTTLLRIYDIASNTVTTKTLPTAVTIYSGKKNFAVFQDTLYMLTPSATTLATYNITTTTSGTLTVPTTDLSWILTVTNNALLTTLGPQGYAVHCYNFISETLDTNTLAILDGINFSIKLITTSLISFLKTFFSNIWWYDTDFKEYPTYIGNGTAWVKIKN